MLNWLTENIFTPIKTWWVEKIWKPSWSKFVAWLYGLPAVLLAAWQSISAIAGDSNIAAYLDKLHVPSWVPAAFAGIALVQYIASGRK